MTLIEMRLREFFYLRALLLLRGGARETIGGTNKVHPGDCNECDASFISLLSNRERMRPFIAIANNAGNRIVDSINSRFCAK